VEAPALEIDELAAPPAGDDEDEEQGPASDPDADPVGDADLLADLGITAHRLLTLCSQEGTLPSDVSAEICARLGCADELDELREA
jgi:putative tRNA adenosine deaminase-associated protein